MDLNSLIGADVFDNRESKAGATEFSTSWFIDTVEALKDTGKGFFWNTDTGVLDGKEVFFFHKRDENFSVLFVVTDGVF